MSSKDQRIYLDDLLERIQRIEQVATEGEAIHAPRHDYS